MTGEKSMKRLQARLRPFARNQQGSVIVEAVLMLPMLIWAGVGMYAYWDAYQTINTTQKAGYAVADMISRRLEPVTMADLNGLNDVMNFLLSEGETARMRVTSVTWSEHDGAFQVQWSKSPGAVLAELTTADLQAYTSRIPAMADGDTVVLLETEVAFAPMFDVGIDPLTIKDLIVTRPRLVPRLCFEVCA